jgi:hypothetical protein
LCFIVPYLTLQISDNQLIFLGKSYLPWVCVISPIQFVTYCYTGEKHSDQKAVNI